MVGSFLLEEQKVEYLERSEHLDQDLKDADSLKGIMKSTKVLQGKVRKYSQHILGFVNKLKR